MAETFEIHYAGEWAALYVGGRLVIVGDTYRTEEEALSLLGVRTVHDDAFMRGQTQRDGVAATVGDIVTYRVERDRRQAEADRLRAEARRLLAEADVLGAPGPGGERS